MLKSFLYGDNIYVLIPFYQQNNNNHNNNIPVNSIALI